MKLWGLTCPKFMRQASKLEIQVRVDIVVLSPQPGNSRSIWLLRSVDRIPFSSGNRSLFS